MVKHLVEHGRFSLRLSSLTVPRPPPSSSPRIPSIHVQALLGRVEASRALLLAGADPNAIDHSSFSPLYLASQNGHTQLVLDLLAAGADTSVKTSRVRHRSRITIRRDWVQWSWAGCNGNMRGVCC